MNSSPLIIAGGGIAGLATALGLEERDVLILEQSKVFSEVGAGLQLGPNAVRALQKLGAWDAVSPITSSPPEIHMRDGVNGKILKRLTLGKNFEQRFGSPYRVAHRADLHDALLSVAKTKANIEVRLGETVTSVENQSGGVSVLSNGKVLNSPAVIAADGVHSRIRQQLFPGTAAIDGGATFHRALLETPKIETVDFECVNVWFYPQGHVVHYRVGIDQVLNLIAITPRSNVPQQHFANAAAPLRSLIAMAEPGFTTWPGLYASPLHAWAKGNVTLLGDAAHATLPYLAQGAAMALEDAACLGRLVKNHGSMAESCDAFHRQRSQRTTRLHLATVAAGKNYHHSGLLRLVRNAVLSQLPDAMLLSQLSWIYKY